MRSVLILILFLFANFSSAQEGKINIEGIVRDRLTEKPLPGGIIIVKKNGVEVERITSDEQGKYNLKAFDLDRKYEIIFDTKGYLPRSIQFDLTGVPFSLYNMQTEEFGTDMTLIPFHPDVDYSSIQNNSSGRFYFSPIFGQFMWDEKITSDYHSLQEDVIAALKTAKETAPEKLYQEPEGYRSIAESEVVEAAEAEVDSDNEKSSKTFWYFIGGGVLLSLIVIAILLTRKYRRS